MKRDVHPCLVNANAQRPLTSKPFLPPNQPAALALP